MNWLSKNSRWSVNSSSFDKSSILLSSVIFFLPFNLKVNAQESTATANPIATSSGSVSNQAVQINQGGYSQQGFSSGHYCNSSTLTFTSWPSVNTSLTLLTRSSEI